MKVSIDTVLCKGCKLCVASCPRKVFEIGSEVNAKGYNYVRAAREDQCIGCKLCEKICPDFVIHVE